MCKTIRNILLSVVLGLGFVANASASTFPASGILDVSSSAPAAYFSDNGLASAGSEAWTLNWNSARTGAKIMSTEIPDSLFQFELYQGATLVDSGAGDTLILSGLTSGSSYELVIKNMGSAVAVYSGIISAVPLPAAVILFGSVLLGMFAFSKRRKFSNTVAA